jgi:hypothetical protein
MADAMEGVYMLAQEILDFCSTHEDKRWRVRSRLQRSAEWLAAPLS